MEQKRKSKYYPPSVIVDYDKYFMMRLEMGYSDTDVAKLAGVNPSIISRWRRGLSQPTPKTLQKLSRVLNCRVKDFLGQLSKAI